MPVFDLPVFLCVNFFVIPLFTFHVTPRCVIVVALASPTGGR